jgi:para-nitrobenzyl esterase
MRLSSHPLLPITLLLALTACSQPQEATDSPSADTPGAARTAADSLDLPPALAGTQWRLLEFQSMDGTPMRPDDGARYTLALGADGRLAMVLDCNRGGGPWSAEPASSGTSGSISIGPIAMTKMACPPPSMGAQIARDMDAVRSYLLRGDTLSLGLMADGGLYLWERAEGSGR